MNKNIVALAVIVLFMFLTTLTSSQVEDKKWSRVSADRNNTVQQNPDYRYLPPPQISRRYFLNETDAVVQANYRVLPTTNTTQSELSIDIHPNNPNILFAGSNGTSWPVSGVYGTGVYWSTNAGNNWSGSDNPSPYFGSGNSGDPAAVIGPNGNFYMGYIRDAGGQGVSVSTNNGLTWSSYTAGADPSSSADLLDKNHLWVDKKTGSAYINRVYDSWTHFVTGSASENQVVINYSSNNGANWSSFVDLSSSLTPGSHAQGVNINTGPDGEVYAVFAIYDNWGSGLYGEDAIAFAKSTNGGATWTSSRIYSAANFGIRGNLKTSSIRVSSFPSMTVDRSGGSRNGYIYICWPQRGVSPAGSDPDIVMISSSDGGENWTTPKRVNTDDLNNGKDQYYPWCTVDQSTGQLHIVFYDNRNTTSDSTGVFMATSGNGGNTFEEFQVSDANFKPKPISGLASGYQGDYIGITASNGKAYPFWADDRTGNYQAWITQVSFGPAIIHTPLPNTENVIGPYVVQATITSINPIVAGSIKVYWSRSGTPNNVLEMTNTGGNNYTANIPGNGLNSTYNYYLIVTDNQGFETRLPSNAPSQYFSFTAETDLVPPTITHTPLFNMPPFSFPPSVTAIVTDNIGIQSVVCEYRKNGGAISSFNLNLLSDNTYQAVFPSIGAAIGDLIEYRIKATDNSSQNNIAFSPSTGFHSFNIIASLGNVLVIDDDVTAEGRFSNDKVSDGASNIPLGASANLFVASLNTAGYTVTQVTFGNLNTMTLSSYDVVILSAGVKESSIFNDITKRTALVNHTLTGGKILVEGGEVGYIYRKAGTIDLHPEFRRNLLLDSVWVSDRPGLDLQAAITTHPIFNIPNVVSSPMDVVDGGTNNWGARDEMVLLPGVTGISRIANWVGGTAANGGIFLYSPVSDTSVCRNIFFSFSVSQFSNQTTAGNLIVNAVRYLMREFIPTTKTLNVTALTEGLWNGTTSVSDVVTVEVRASTTPYAIVETKNIQLNTSGFGSDTFTTPSEGTPYYIVVKHSNSIETWSSSPVQFSSGILNYNFTDAQNKAYGNNLKMVNGKWCIYSGDVNQDGSINISDLNLVFTDNLNGVTGNVVTDLTGDQFTEVNDLNIVFVNSVLGVTRQRPAGVSTFHQTGFGN
ncbi:MAG: exo-alpha-sialidase [Ignavibacteriales bacterium]|nr:MAG: exo-alpha-sialidase [Ignavibacteriales bacterium]